MQSWTLPDWITLDVNTWIISWTPAVYQAWTYSNIVVRVTDDKWWTWDSASFTLTINPKNMIILDTNWTLKTETGSTTITWILVTIRWNSNSYSWWYVKYWLSWWALSSREDLTWPITWAETTLTSLTEWRDYQYQIFVEDKNSNMTSSTVLGFQSDKLSITNTWSFNVGNTTVQFSWIVSEIFWTSNGLAPSEIKYSTNSWLVLSGWWTWIVLTWPMGNLEWSKTWLKELETYYYMIYVNDTHWHQVASALYSFQTTSDAEIRDLSNWLAFNIWTWSVSFNWISVVVGWVSNAFSWAYLMYSTSTWILTAWWWDRIELNWDGVTWTVNLTWAIASGLTDYTKYYYVIYADDTTPSTPKLNTAIWPNHFTTELITWIWWNSTDKNPVNVKINWDWITTISSESWSVTFDITANIIWYKVKSETLNNINFTGSELRYWTDPAMTTYSTTWLTLAPSPTSAWTWTDVNLAAIASWLWVWNYSFQVYLEDNYWNSAISDTGTFSIISELVPANWIIIASNWTAVSTKNSISINWINTLVVAGSWVNVFSWAYLEYWSTLWLWTKVMLTWTNSSLSAAISWLSASTVYYYRITAQDSDILSNDAQSSILQITTLAAPAPPTVSRSSWGWWWGWWWAWAWAWWNYCDTRNYYISLNKSSMPVNVTWNLDLNNSDGKVNRPIVMADCSSKYRLEMQSESLITKNDWSLFDWEVEVVYQSSKERPAWTDTLTVIRWFEAWWENWEVLKYSKDFIFTSPVYLSKWMTPDKIKFFYYDNWVYTLAWDWWVMASDNKSISVKLNRLENLVVVFDPSAEEEVESVHGSSIWFWNMNTDWVPFKDIWWHWAKSFIEKAYRYWIVHWKTWDMFHPDANITRAELVKISIKAFGLEVPENITEKPFKDVEIKYWYSAYVAAWKFNNIMTWYPDQSARPNNHVIRAESLKVLLASAWFKDLGTVGETQFQDVFTNNWFYPYVAFSEKLWIVEWYTIPEIAPLLELVDSFLIIWDRSDAIKSLQVVLKDLWFIDFEPSGYYWLSTQAWLARYLYNKWIIRPTDTHDWVTGPTTETIVETLISEFKKLRIEWDQALFRPRNSITRAEAVKVLIRLLEIVFKI